MMIRSLQLYLRRQSEIRRGKIVLIHMKVVVEGKILIPTMELILQIGIILKREVDMKCEGVRYVYLPMKGAVTFGNMVT